MSLLILNLSENSGATLQAQIVRQIRALVLSGDLEEGSELPSIRALAGQQHVSVITVQRAYEMLERMKLIGVRRGRGYYVSQLDTAERKSLAVMQLSHSMAPAIEQALAEGLEAHEVRELLERILAGVPA